METMYDITRTTVSNIYANANRKTENRHENKVPC